MGNQSSVEPQKIIYVDIRGRHEKITFSPSCAARDICFMLEQAAGLTRSGNKNLISLHNKSGVIIPVSPNMPMNDPTSPYHLILNNVSISSMTSSEVDEDSTDKESIDTVITQVVDQFNKAFKLEEIQTDLYTRIRKLEELCEKEHLKMMEIQRLQRDIFIVQDLLSNENKPDSLQYKRLSCLSVESKTSSKRDVPTYPKYTLSKETTDYLKQPTFDMWHWEPNEMLSLMEHMYHDLQLVKEFNINPVTLKRWLLCVQENYRNNPFHNFRHCFCVTQMMYGLVHFCHLGEKLSREDIGILLTACICHDLDHPGYNNTYQINAKTDLAVRYNNISPLENHHCSVAFQILGSQETNIFANVDQKTQNRIHNQMQMLILATDMAKHNEILENFNRCLEEFDFTNKEHVKILKIVLVKCCDISNELRPFNVSEPWLDCLLEEYFHQGDREKEEGLPVAPFMDRNKVTKPTAQIGFIKFVLLPMFYSLAKLFPKLSDTIVKSLVNSLERYETMKKKCDRENAENGK